MFRKEYPRPNLVRENWELLNGEWNFSFDDENIGLKEKWYDNVEKICGKIQVPFAYQSELSGIGDVKSHEVVWYQKEVKMSKEWKNKKIKINFGAVDYRCKLYVNGNFVGEHEGGHINFSFDITEYLNNSIENIVLRVEDPSKDEMIPRGKQYWKEESEVIWYTRTTGIWQSVWLEPVDETHIERVKFTPDINRGNVEIDLELSQIIENLNAQITVTFKNEIIVEDTYKIIGDNFNKILNLFDKKIFRSNAHNDGWLWTPESPSLFDVKIKLSKDNIILDSLDSYFGMRKVSIDQGMFYLNNKPYFQKLVLDQGYWPKGLLTAPSDEDFITDIKLSKEMGFNGCRKHQKIEDPRFLYWADKLGYLVWGEMASCIEYNDKSVNRIVKEWMDSIKRDYNHPCIIAWVPLNESWGVPRIKYDEKEQSHSLAMYYLTKSLDTSRVVISNDGWELTKTDICGIHNYNQGNIKENSKYEYYCNTLKSKEEILKSMPAGKKVYADGFHHDDNTPIMLTEFGGIAYDKNHPKGWGYSSASSEDEFVLSYERVINAIYSSEIINGFCYTQITDVEQEVNGLLTYDRKPKCNLSKIKEINDRLIREKIYK